MNLTTQETKKGDNQMLENIVDKEADARDVMDSLRGMIEEEGNPDKHKHNAHLATCECCGGTGIEAVLPELKAYPHQRGWSNPPALCSACEGEGNYVVNYDYQDPEESWDAGRY